MDKATIIEAVAMYWPMALCTALYLLSDKTHREKKKRALTAGMISSVWIAAVLPWVNDLCVHLGYWNFDVDHNISILGLPVSLYIGWILLWGFLPALIAVLLEKWNPVTVIVIFILLDIITMPFFAPVMSFSASYKWLIGEALLILVILTPSIFLSHWVIRDSHVAKRSTLISFSFILIILTIIPVSSPLAAFNPLEVWQMFPSYLQYLYLIILILISLPGIAGVIEFARVGNGTPIPYDPPKQLITTGVYMYVRNPMQLSMVLVIMVWAIIFLSWLMFSVAVIALVYCLGLASWSEACDLKQRYGGEWERYSMKVKLWKLSIFPKFVAEKNTQLYVDTQCAKCLEVKYWIEKKSPSNLDIVSAADWKGEPLSRITYYDPNTGKVLQGVLAFAKALQHIHIGWALLGWFISLPVICSLIQASLDASGLAPQRSKG